MKVVLAVFQGNEQLYPVYGKFFCLRLHLQEFFQRLFWYLISFIVEFGPNYHSCESISRLPSIILQIRSEEFQRRSKCVHYVKRMPVSVHVVDIFLPKQSFSLAFFSCDFGFAMHRILLLIVLLAWFYTDVILESRGKNNSELMNNSLIEGPATLMFIQFLFGNCFFKMLYVHVCITFVAYGLYCLCIMYLNVTINCADLI